MYVGRSNRVDAARALIAPHGHLPFPFSHRIRQQCEPLRSSRKRPSTLRHQQRGIQQTCTGYTCTGTSILKCNVSSPGCT